MQYRGMGQTGDSVSILGYGCMRFPKTGGRTDEERTERQILSAIEGGVNYFDTAYIYPGSEVTLGNILARNAARDKVLVATKLPLFLTHSRKDMDKTFEVSLQRLKTDHVDYYLMHNITSAAGWQRIRDLGVEEFLEGLKRDGRVRRIGFSYHGDKAQFADIVDSYPWDFCQIQYNFMDENFQAGSDGLRYAAGKGLGVVVMEPLRGGLLSGRVPPAVRDIWNRAEEKRSPAEWALRWIWNHPEVTTVLSGMNEEEHIAENIRAASAALPNAMSERELGLVAEVREQYRAGMKIGCTGCAYCMPCPAGVNIPTCFSYYNDMHLYGEKSLKFKYTALVGVDGSRPSYASLCVGCGKCERHCPQNLPIRAHLKEVSNGMEGFYLKPLAGMVKGYYRLKGRKRKKATE